MKYKKKRERESSGPDLLQAFQIISQLHIKSIGNDLRVLSILVILLPIQKPVWDFELTRVGNNSHQIVQLSCTQFPSSNKSKKTKQIQNQYEQILYKIRNNNNKNQI